MSEGPVHESDDRMLQEIEQRLAAPKPEEAASAPRAAAAAWVPPPGAPNVVLPSSFEMAHLLDYVRILYRRRWPALTAFALIVLVTVLYTYTRVPLYQTGVRMMLQSQRQNYGFKDIADNDDKFVLQTQFEILKSRALARRALMNIAQEKAGQPGVQPGTKEPSRGAIGGFVGGVVVYPVAGTNLVDVGYRSIDAATAAQRANALARAFVDENLDMKSQATREASDWLTDRLNEQRQKVETSEAALQKYRERNDVVALDERDNPLVKNLGDLASAVTRAKTERIEKETLYKRLKGAQNDPEALESFPAVTSDPSVQQARNEVAQLDRQVAALSDRFGERHPDLIRTKESLANARTRLQNQMGRFIEAAATSVQAAQSAEVNMVRVFESQKAQAFAANRSGVELAILMRDLESNRQIYDNLVKQTKEIEITNEIRTNNVRVLDWAEVPGGPIWPNRAKNIQYSILGGLLFGLALAFFLDYLDNRVKTPDDIKTQLGVPYLGLIPAVTKKHVQENGLLATSGVPSSFAEALRGIRTNLIFSMADQGPHVISVTSANPSEGKTLVSTNLAIALAQAGQRVILIDADMRRPRVHEVFGMKAEPGLSNLLVSEIKASEVIRRASIPNLRVLTAGRIPPNPAELLGAPRFKRLIDVLKEHADWVIIDTPPVLAVTDGQVVAHLTNGVVFVATAELTARHSARAALEALAVVRARVLGAVLNRVQLDRHSYYYSKYYKKGYDRYYRKSAS